MPDDDGLPLTWGEWEQDALPFEDAIPDAADLAVTRANEQAAETQQDMFDYAVGLYQIPTATSNPERPRTVAAKFEPREGAIYVVMRPYRSHGSMKTPVVKYSPMKITDWRNFRSAYSKGRYIALNWEGGDKEWEELSSLGGYDEFLTTAASYAMSQQQARDGLQAGQHPSSDIYKKLRRAVAEGRRVTDVKLRSDRLGGGTRRRTRNDLDSAMNAFYKNSTPPTIG